MLRLRRVLAAAAALSPLLGAQRPLNLLFYGNSYSHGNASVPALVGVIADAAGRGLPNVVARLVGGTNLTFHATDPMQVAAITTALPAGERWDYVVLQGMSTEATRLGNPAAFRAAALTIVTNVRAHSPNARVVLYQTWARAYGATFYPNAFANPSAMHEEVRANYDAAAADIDRVFGAGTTKIARVGDAVAALAHNPSLYEADLSHPRHQITLLAGMTIYTALWQDQVSRLTPVITQQTPIGRHFIGNGFTLAMWQDMRCYADLVAERRLRRFAGSSEDLLLRTGTATSVLPCAVHEVTAPATVAFEVITPNWVYQGSLAGLLLDLPPSGPPPLFPELWITPGTSIALATTASLANRLSLTVPIPVDLSGATLLLQGLALARSRRMANPLFTATDGIELRVR
jgi:hypothetical protein